MTREKAIEQLKSLLDDRKSFLTGDKENDEVFLKDIEALEFIIKENKEMNMNKDDSIDAMRYCVKQKQIDEMYEYTKDYGRIQFVEMLVEQREEIAKLKKELEEQKKNNQIMFETKCACIKRTNKYKRILDELKQYLKEESLKTFVDIVHLSAYEKVINKIEELER